MVIRKEVIIVSVIEMYLMKSLKTCLSVCCMLLYCHCTVCIQNYYNKKIVMHGRKISSFEN